MNLTKTEHLVLRAMRLVDRVSASDIQADIAAGRIDADELAHTDRVRQEFVAIWRATAIEATSTPPSETRVRQALRGLVRKGAVNAHTLEGMGGGFTTYMRTEA